MKKKNEIAALAASERRDADLDRLFAALSTMRFFFNDTATTEIYTLSLHDALPILTELRSYSKEHKIVRERLRDLLKHDDIFVRKIGRAHV